MKFTTFVTQTEPTTFCKCLRAELRTNAEGCMYKCEVIQL